MHRIHLVISGLVQGVFFRANTVEEGIRLGLTGWVRNLPDGNVETVAEGSKEKLEQFSAWCRRGPAPSRVTNVEVSWEPATGEFKGFSIKGRY